MSQRMNGLGGANGVGEAISPAAKMEILRLRLMAPFEDEDVKRKPQKVSGNRALAVTYVDVRAVMDRLDEVFGVAGWANDYETLDDGSVICRLSCLFGAEWVTKSDVGSPSEQPDGGDRLKAAFSDALKRAAVKYGIGRYLYRIKPEWMDYDPNTRQIAAPKATVKASAKTVVYPKTETGILASKLHGMMAQLGWNKTDPAFVVAVGQLIGRTYKPGDSLSESEMHAMDRWLAEQIEIRKAQ